MRAAAAVAALFVLYCLFAATISIHEIWLALLFTLATAAFTALAWRASGVRFCTALRDLIRAWQIPWLIVLGSVTVTGVLIEDLAGTRTAGSHLCMVRFGSTDAARIVLATTYMTISPNSIVLGVDQARHILVFHQLGRRKAPRMVLDLGGVS